jgi:hypothetical protein
MVSLHRPQRPSLLVVYQPQTQAAGRFTPFNAIPSTISSCHRTSRVNSASHLKLVLC